MDPSQVRSQRKFYSERDLCQISCRACNERLSSMRKTAVRWLYMEWYKKAVLGQHLPSVKELTPRIIAVLQVVHEEKSKENTNKFKCSVCERNLETLITQSLSPLQHHQEMQSNSLPRNFSLASTAGRKQSKEDDGLGLSVKSYIRSIDAELNSNLEMNSNEPGEKVNQDEQNDSSTASFFARAAQRLSLTSKRRHRKSRRSGKHKDSDSTSLSAQEQGAFPTNFADLIMRCPPQAPPSLFKQATKKSGDTNGKVKVMLRVSDLDDCNAPSCLKLDPKKKQAYLCDIRDANISPRLGKEAKLYQFDTMFDSATTKPEICSSSLVDLLHTVVNYSDDASFIVYGHPNLGKTKSMVGEDDKCENLGIIPCAISWLYQLIEDRKERTGARFSVRVSAVEIVGKSENLNDLLADQATGSINNCSTSPSLYLQRERTGPVQLADFTELRAPTAEKASFFFDAAIASRTKLIHDETNIDPNEDISEKQNSNMIFTFHVYQYLIDKVGTGDVRGGRSRFHLIDLSGCKKAKRNKDFQGSSLSLSNLGSVLVALANGAKHIPHRDSKLTVLLREAFGALSSRIALAAFVSGDPKKYTETLSTMEVTTRIHRSRRKKSRYSSGSSGGDSSCDEARRVRRRPKPVQPMLITRACESDTIGDSEFTTSAAEDSCDTVIYVGPKGQAVSDAELTDFERPPSTIDIYTSKDDLLEEKLNLSDHEIDYKPEIVEKNCSCNLQNNNTSRTCIHTTEMKSVDTSYKSELSLLASFSDNIEKPSTKPLIHTLSKEDLSSYDISENARNALHHPSTPFYYLVPGCPKSDSNGLINNFIQRRNRSNFRSYRERSTSQQFSSQEEISSTRGRKSSRDESPQNRTASLDRYFIRNEKTQNDNESCFINRRNSDESIASSQQTVCEFERDLVSKIVERFDVEQEIADLEPDLISSFLEKEEKYINDLHHDYDYQNKRMSTDDSIIVTVTSQERLDPSYIDSLNLKDTLRKQREASFSEFLKNTESLTASDRPDNEATQPWEPRVDFSKDPTNMDNFTSKDQDGTRTASRLGSASSCGSLLVIPKAIGLASEGVSSGYESMRCESSGNLNTVSDLDSERGKCKSSKKDKKSSSSKGKDKKSKDTPSIPESGIFNNEDNADRSRFGKGKSHKKDLKTLLGERKSMKDSLQQVLQRLVLLKNPVSDVDARLSGLSFEDPQAVRTLNRENRILQRKVDVCKSHLQLVTCFDANPQNVVTRRFLYKTTAV